MSIQICLKLYTLLRSCCLDNETIACDNPPCSDYVPIFVSSTTTPGFRITYNLPGWKKLSSKFFDRFWPQSFQKNSNFKSWKLGTGSTPAADDRGAAVSPSIIEYTEFDGKYFGAYCPGEPIDFITAKSACQDSGGYLALPTTAEMNTWVRNALLTKICYLRPTYFDQNYLFYFDQNFLTEILTAKHTYKFGQKLLKRTILQNLKFKYYVFVFQIICF